MSAEEFFGDFFEEIAKRDETISRAPKEAFVKRTPPVRNLNADKDDDEPRGARTSRAGEPPAADGKAADRFDVDQELAKTDASGAPTAGAGARRAVGGAPGELVAGLTPAEVTKLPAERRIALALDEKTKGNECFAAKEWHQAVLHYTHSLYLDQNSAAVYAFRAAETPHRAHPGRRRIHPLRHARSPRARVRAPTAPAATPIALSPTSS